MLTARLCSPNFQTNETSRKRQELLVGRKKTNRFFSSTARGFQLTLSTSCHRDWQHMCCIIILTKSFWNRCRVRNKPAGNCSGRDYLLGDEHQNHKRERFDFYCSTDIFQRSHESQFHIDSHFPHQRDVMRTNHQSVGSIWWSQQRP